MTSRPSRERESRVEALLGVLAVAAALAAAAAAPRRAGERCALAAVDAEAWAGLSGRAPAAAGDLWERLKAMGVSAAVLREDTLADLAARGEVLSFSRAEVEKWRAAGLIAPNSGLRGGTLWARDPKALARAADALAARGLDVSTASVGGLKALELAPGADLARVPAGFDPKTVAALSSAGLLPVAASTGPQVAVAGRLLWTRTLPVDARPGEVLRAALGRPRRLIAFRPRADLGLDANADLLRASLRVLRESGPGAALPAREEPREGDAERRARLALVWVVGLAGPMLAARAGLQAARAARARVCALGISDAASPAPQVLAGVAAAWGLAAFAGLAAAGVAPAGWRDGSARAWTLWTWCAPLAIGAAALSSASRPGRRGLSAPLRRRDLAALAALLAAAALLLAPRAALRVSGLWESFDRLSAAGSLWWWPWRWREVLVGVPCLVVALALVEARDAAEVARAPLPRLLGDPRGWLLLGLLAPAGLVAAVGGGGAPLGGALVHGALAHALGLVLGLALAGLRSWAERWASRPIPHRTIDPDAGN